METSGILTKIPKEEDEKVKQTIKNLVSIFSQLKIEYRIFGSVLIAAILGRPQRRLGDIDVMIGVKDKSSLLRKLKREGYRLEERQFRFLGLHFFWAEATKNDRLALTLFIGKFDEQKNFLITISKNLTIIVHSQAIRPTRYHFGDTFVGVPMATAYYGALASRGNPKRKFDLAVFEAKEIARPPAGYSVINIYYQGKKLAFLYPLSCFLQDILGRVSLFLGRNYDFWRR